VIATTFKGVVATSHRAISTLCPRKIQIGVKKTSKEQWILYTYSLW